MGNNFKDTVTGIPMKMRVMETPLLRSEGQILVTTHYLDLVICSSPGGQLARFESRKALDTLLWREVTRIREYIGAQGIDIVAIYEHVVRAFLGHGSDLQLFMSFRNLHTNSDLFNDGPYKYLEFLEAMK